MQDVAIISGPRGRLVSIVFVVLAVGMAYLGAKWQLGDMLARLTSSTDPNALIIADAARGLAPSDPYTSSLRSQIGLNPDSPDRRSEIEIAEQTVRLSPYDHRWHIALARALASDGQIVRAETEFKRAVELAPSYADCAWYYGNFLLRQGRRDDAMAQFETAAGGDPGYRTQVFSLVWDYTAHDPAAVESVSGDGVDSITELARFLAAHGRGSDALRDWDRLTPDQKAGRTDIERDIAEGLFDQHKFADALEFSRQLGADADSRLGMVTNGSFETSIDPGANSHFNWRVLHNDPKFDIVLDDRVKRDGVRSLRLTFKGTSRPNLFNAAQIVAVTPDARYRLTFWVRTENLRAPAGPLVDVSTGDESKSLAATPPLPNGTNEWRQMSLDIHVPADTDGIEIRTLRMPCGGDDCPISGIVWYDDFVLTRL